MPERFTALTIQLQNFREQGGEAPVVILRRSSNFDGATFSGVYVNRDCPFHFHTDAAANAGGAQLNRRLRKQAAQAVPGRVQHSRAPSAAAKRDGAQAVLDRLEQGSRAVASGSF